MHRATISPSAAGETNRRRPLLAPALVLLLAAAGLFPALPTATGAMRAAASPSDSPPAEPKSKEPSIALAQTVPPKVHRYAERLLRRYDLNRDGRLDASEWRKMHGNPQTADGDKDRTITLGELTDHILQFGRHRRLTLGLPSFDPEGSSQVEGDQDTSRSASPDNGVGLEKAGKVDGGPSGDEPSKPLAARSGQPNSTFYVPRSRLPAGLPEWFLRRDADGDGQLSLAEYAPKPSQADLDEFARYDLNGDGFITPKEYLRAGKPARQSGAKPSAAPSANAGDESSAKPASQGPK